MFPVNLAHVDYVTLVGGSELKYTLHDMLNALGREFVTGHSLTAVAGGRYKGDRFECTIGDIAMGERDDDTRFEGYEFCVQSSGYVAEIVKKWVDGQGLMIEGDSDRRGVKCSRIDHAYTIEGRLDHMRERDKLRGYIKEDSHHDGTVYRGVRDSRQLTRTYQKGEFVRLELQWNKDIARQNWGVQSAVALRGEIESVRGRRWYKGSIWDDFSLALGGGEGFRAKVGETRDEGYERWLQGVISHLTTRKDSAERVIKALNAFRRN